MRWTASGYVKAYVKRNKNDAADAEAICEAVTRPTMRFVPIKSGLCARRPAAGHDGIDERALIKLSRSMRVESRRLSRSPA